MVLADAKDIESDPIGVLDLFDQLAHAVRGRDRPARLGVRRGEAVDSDFH